MTHIEIWALYAIFTYLKFMSDSSLQGIARFKSASFAYPEDQKVFSKDRPPGAPGDGLNRATALFRNDLENMVPFGFLSLAAAFLHVNLNTYSITIATFCVSRVLHAYFMMKARQPHRNFAYQLGNVCQIILIVVIVAELLSR